jgi:hypothetical protein
MDRLLISVTTRKKSNYSQAPMVCTCHLKQCGRLKSGRWQFQATPGKKMFAKHHQQQKSWAWWHTIKKGTPSK